MSNVVLKKCGCKGNPDHAQKYQDKTYGEGMRVMTSSQKGEYTCTVCGKKHK